MSIIEKSKKYVQGLFEKGNTELLTYHNWSHTKNVLEASELIARNSKEVEEDKVEQIQLAAIFHDAGFLEGSEDHEARGAEKAISFL